jgi:S1-C subfamily serine protease
MRQHTIPGVLVALVAVLATGCGGRTDSTATTTTTPVFADLVAQVRSGVVRIEVETCDGRSVGSGFLVGPRLVATVEHVVAGASKIQLKRSGKNVAVGTVIGTDKVRDLALIRTDRPINGYVFHLAGAAPRLGDEVGALGFPLGLPLTVTKGSVSGLDRTITIEGTKRGKLVQTDAALNPGNSGGPLIALTSGKVVGLIDAGTTAANGIAFAVNSKTAAALIAAWEAAPQPVSPAKCRKPARPEPTPTPTPTTPSQDVFQSPSGNIRCAYLNQGGVACMTLNDGLGAVLRSFDTSYNIDDPYSFNPPAGRTIPYGKTWAVSSFRCYSSTDGMECSSTVTGHGFFISRDTRRIY